CGPGQGEGGGAGRGAGGVGEGERRRLTNRDAVARGIKRPAGGGRYQLQRVKTVERGQAQRVHSADHRGVEQTRGDRALRRGEHLGARGAGRGDDHRRALELQCATYERAEREGVVRAAVAKVGGQRAARRIEAPERLLGLEYSRGAGAEEQANAVGAVALRAAGHRLGKAVLRQAEERQAVVAALELSE